MTSSGMLPASQGVGRMSCTDGTSNTIIVGEQGDWLRNTDLNQPAKYHGDAGWDPQGTAGTGPRDGGGFLCGTATSAPVPTVNPPGAAAAKWDGDCYNVTTVRYRLGLKQVLGARPLPGCSEDHGTNNPLQSAHPGGAYVAMADGSVRALSEKVDLSVLLQLAIRDDGQAPGDLPTASLESVSVGQSPNGPTAARARTWMDATGQFKVEAELVEVKDGMAVLKRVDGRVVNVPISKLSEADRNYLKSWDDGQHRPDDNPPAEATAVEILTKLGGKITRDETSPGRPVITVDLRSAGVTDAALEHLTGMTQLQMLDLDNTPVTDAGLRHLEGLTQLNSLCLTRTRVTDAGLDHLKKLTQLGALWLFETKVTDAGLVNLKGLTKLYWLELPPAALTDASLEHLKELTGLQRLNLSRTQVTDAGLKHLSGLIQLQELNLTSTAVTGTGLERLKGLSRLQKLFLSNTPVTDAGLERLKGLTQLQLLSLLDTPVTDAGLEHLKSLTQIKMLGLRGTQVTDAGVKELKNALPNAQILR